MSEQEQQETQKAIYNKQVLEIGSVRVYAESDNKAQLEMITKIIQNAFFNKNKLNQE